MKEFIRSVCELLDRGESIVLATVVQSNGSTPRSSGAKMAVRSDGSIVGTVGGGLAEAMACRKSLDLLAKGDGAALSFYVDMTQELAANSDMICGGGLTILLEVLAPGGKGESAYSEVDNLMRKGIRCMLRTRFEEHNEMSAIRHTVVEADRSGCMEFLEDGIVMELCEPFIPPASLFIFGGGHVSLSTETVGSLIGFRTVILDDREDFANRKRFPNADEVVVLSSFENCCDGLPITDDSFIVIVTRGHLHDRTVLADALRTGAGYIGMIGSKKKRDKIYDSILADGFSQADIERCHCPIGLTIGAQTPEEIAVSIGAELIQIRAEMGV
ncbi:XdhC family aldehyde oxidoreductase maturation factor [Pseudodesulfovibrio sp. zrk46]|uniref:XdhC family aldehyde oxidoreductase maturation factor n=1 Tax=Pseudodesulfovibrio sp. zrk46 TaxID=2725288 RepID=UPI0014498B07|nr:XdhC/CoxI family protein [Pseudodesulfovibrio sp. zrk46]QJB57424.1 XdhC family protein [Pseudodesulfovibrio sp. zrk46]